MKRRMNIQQMNAPDRRRFRTAAEQFDAPRRRREVLGRPLCRALVKAIVQRRRQAAALCLPSECWFG